MPINYHVQPLLDMAQEFLETEKDYRIFMLTFKGGHIPDLDPCEYGKYVKKNTKRNQLWYDFHSICEIVNADANLVLATAKTINRYRKKERWKTCIYIDMKTEESARQLFNVWPF